MGVVLDFSKKSDVVDAEYVILSSGRKAMLRRSGKLKVAESLEVEKAQHRLTKIIESAGEDHSDEKFGLYRIMLTTFVPDLTDDEVGDMTIDEMGELSDFFAARAQALAPTGSD